MAKGGGKIKAAGGVIGAIMSIASSLVNTATNPEWTKPVKHGENYLKAQQHERRSSRKRN